MDVPYPAIFLVLLLAYLVYSEWARLDPRYPVAAALVLLGVTAVVDALGALAAANTLAEYVFFLLAGGVGLLLVDHVRAGRRAAAAAPALGGTVVPPVPSTEPPDERQGPPEDPLDRPEQEAVSLVQAAGGEHRDDEPAGRH